MEMSPALFHRRGWFLALFVCLLCLPSLSACVFPTPLTVDAGEATPILIRTVPVCSALPGYATGTPVADRIIDLDPSVPQERKTEYVILMQNGEVVDIYFSTKSQLNAYLLELSEPFCLLPFPVLRSSPTVYPLP